MGRLLLAIIDSGCAASTRYRVTQFAGHFKEHGIRIQTVAWSRDREEQKQVLELVEKAEAVVVQRILPRTAMIGEIRKRARRLAYDFDDAVICSESGPVGPRVRWSRWWRFRQMVRVCDVVTAGNDYLADLARRHAENAQVFVVPTVVEVERYDREKSKPDAGPVAGWIGGRSTLPYLEQLRRPLEQLSSEIPGFSVLVIADHKPDLGKTRVELATWSERGEVRDLKRLHVGLAPLPDDAWTRGKCGLRLLQYMAAGVPAVASPVGTQADLVRSGAALAAKTDDEWLRTIRKILKKPAAELAAKGRETVKTHFSTAVWGAKLPDIWCNGK